MIDCPSCGTKLFSLSDLTLHLLIDHDDDDLDSTLVDPDPECPNPKCDGGWIEDRHDPEQVEKCPKCGGTGRVA